MFSHSKLLPAYTTADVSHSISNPPGLHEHS